MLVGLCVLVMYVMFLLDDLVVVGFFGVLCGDLLYVWMCVL